MDYRRSSSTVDYYKTFWQGGDPVRYACSSNAYIRGSSQMRINKKGMNFPGEKNNNTIANNQRKHKPLTRVTKSYLLALGTNKK